MGSLSAARPAALGAALAVALSSAAACGGGGAEQGVRESIRQLQSDFAAGRFAAACARMTARPARQLGSVGHGVQPSACARDLHLFVLGVTPAGEPSGSSLERAAKPEVVDVTVAPGGEAATATLTLGADPFEVPLVLEDGRWKLDGFFGAVAPTPRPLR